LSAATTPAQTSKAAPLDTVPVGQFFAAAGKAPQLSPFAGHTSKGQEAAENDDLDVESR
jgi:hypothetical protein